MTTLFDHPLRTVAAIIAAGALYGAFVVWCVEQIERRLVAMAGDE